MRSLRCKSCLLMRVGAWLGICHIRQEGVEYQVNIAVWTDSREGYDAELRAYLARQNMQLIWSEEVFQAADWTQKYPAEKNAPELARTVRMGHLVEMGAISKEAVTNYVQIEEIADVEPLNMQLGAAKKKTVPDALYQPLFGQTKAAPQKLYAVLDAAKITNLSTILATSELQYRCLFKGDAYKELKDVAPYVIELEEDNAFTRSLFTRAGMPGDLWDKAPGILMRSEGSLDDMWRHFRKFTRVQDEKGKWYYFRFWETAIFAHYLANADYVIENAALLFGVRSDVVSNFFTMCDQQVLKYSLTKRPQYPQARFILGDKDRELFRKQKWQQFKIRLFDIANEEHKQQFANVNFASFDKICEDAHAAGYVVEIAIYDYTRSRVFCDQNGLDFSEIHKSISASNTGSDVDRSNRLWSYTKDQITKKDELCVS